MPWLHGNIKLNEHKVHGARAKIKNVIQVKVAAFKIPPLLDRIKSRHSPNKSSRKRLITFYVREIFNGFIPRAYMQTHTPTVVEVGLAVGPPPP